MRSDPLAALAGIPGVRRFPGYADEAALGFDGGAASHLPAEHVEVLRASNGVQVWNGYFRLFGMGTGSYTDAIEWNGEECWKFAWGERALGYWCFGGTAWGDQYAYRTEELERGEEAPVYFLDAWSLTPAAVAPNFRAFLDHEFARVARVPYDEHLLRASERFGPIDGNTHLVYVPSVLLGAEETLEHVQLLPARAAMILSGDIALQVDSAPQGAHPSRLETHLDGCGRTRVRVVWQ